MRYNILMKVVAIEDMHEISLCPDNVSEKRIEVICETPVNEMETYAAICRYFKDGENFDYDFTQQENHNLMTGKMTMTRPENMKNLEIREYIIPLPDEIVDLLKTGKHDAEDISAKKLTTTWFGDLLD